MLCPFCKSLDTDRVVDSRESDGGRVVRRRRVCMACNKRFTTYERIEEPVRLLVIKKDGSRVPFDRNKILTGVQHACYKQPVSAEAVSRLVDEVEEEVFRNFDREVTSQFIGEHVADRLRALNKVAYVRFASVYREFKDLEEFLNEVRRTMERTREEVPGQGDLFKAVP